MIICGTGHRPEDSEDEGIVRLKVRLKLEATPAATTFITGMAAGFDLWAGAQALEQGLTIVCAVPWVGHEPREGDEELYEKLLLAAHHTEYVTDVLDYPGPWVYHKRNEWMVDHADAVLAYWSGKEKGGTYACVQYARKKKAKIANIYHDPPF
jgi:uncharacterized phage-like protein YoqJ